MLAIIEMRSSNQRTEAAAGAAGVVAAAAGAVADIAGVVAAAAEAARIAPAPWMEFGFAALRNSAVRLQLTCSSSLLWFG